MSGTSVLGDVVRCSLGVYLLIAGDLHSASKPNYEIKESSQMADTNMDSDFHPEPFDRKLGESKRSDLGLSVSRYLRARKQYATDHRMYTPPDNIPANKDAILGHLNTQIRMLRASAKKYAALRALIENIPSSEDSPEWQLLRNTVVYGTLDKPEPAIRGPEGIWLADSE